MKIAQQIPAYLLGLIYVVFGLNFFFNFIPAPKDPPSADMANFAGVLMSSGFLKVVKFMEVTFGIMMFVKPTRALGQVLIAPITVGIFLVELLIMKDAKMGLAMLALNAAAIYFDREKYLPIVK